MRSSPLSVPRTPPRLRTTRLPRLLWSLDEAGVALGLSPRFLTALAAAGDVPNIKIGSLRKFDPVKLAEWIQAGAPCLRWEAARARRKAAERNGGANE